MTSKQIAIIPARGGSKRLPRKNILPVNGHPMIAYPIRVAMKSGLFDDVIVSTEDKEIGEIAANYGATIITRPQELARSQSTVAEVCTHLLSLPEYLEIERFCCVYATALLIEVDHLIDSNKLMSMEPKADYVMGVSSYNYQPVQALKEDSDYLKYMWPEFKGKQSQDYPNLVVSNGTFYWARTQNFLNDGSFYGDRLKGYQLHAIDVDTAADYEELLKASVEHGLILK